MGKEHHIPVKIRENLRNLWIVFFRVLGSSALGVPYGSGKKTIQFNPMNQSRVNLYPLRSLRIVYFALV
jgi:hypothetical protein